MKKITTLLGLMFLFTFTSCSNSSGGGGGGDGGGNISSVDGGDGGGDGSGDGGGGGKIASVLLIDNRVVYDQDSLEVLTLNVRTLPGGATIEEVNADDDYKNPLYTTALVTVEEPGNLFSNGASIMTGKLRIRGHASRGADLKSYRIKLDQINGANVLWRNLRTLQLNKHPWDLTRLRQKLSFDFFKFLPNMASLRTLFVHLFIDGVDYGLYTLIERPNERFLAAHGFDETGWLYNARSFEFKRYADEIKNTSDTSYNKDVFETRLEIRGETGDHSKLIAMLTAVNDERNDINTVIAEHFQLDNYLTWFAMNILLGNEDTTSQNFYLYSPTTHNKWYLLPWDYDGALKYNDQPNRSDNAPRRRKTIGVSNWWNVVLHQRFLKDPDNVAALVAKVQELRSFFAAPVSKSFLDLYREVVTNILTFNPDLDTLNALNDATDADIIAEWSGEIDSLPSVPEEKYQEFMDALERPMPIWLSSPRMEEGMLLFRWEESFDLQGDSITYDFQVSATRDFAAIVIEQLDMIDHSILIDPATLGPGTFYYRITIRDSKGNWQYPFEYIQEGSDLFDGLQEFTVSL